jgi:signal transduction histidine kinase
VRRADRLGTLGTLAAGIAHEINNPLVSIRTFLTLAPAKRTEMDREFWGEYNQLALKEVDRIHGLVKTMGRLGRASDETAPRVPCDVAALVQEAVLLLSPEASQGRVVVELDVSPETPKLLVVRDHLHQVVLNLVLNAIQATAPARRGRRHQPAIRIAVRPPFDGAPGVCIEVADDGCSIRGEDLERVFDPFFTPRHPIRVRDSG